MINVQTQLIHQGCQSAAQGWVAQYEVMLGLMQRTGATGHQIIENPIFGWDRVDLYGNPVIDPNFSHMLADNADAGATNAQVYGEAVQLCLWENNMETGQ